MIRKCCSCNRSLGEKEPYDDRSVTHTWCNDCWAIEMARATIRKAAKAIYTENNEKPKFTGGAFHAEV